MMNNNDMIGYVVKGRYKLIDERGRGNFAAVYITRDMETNHLYALKALRPELSSDLDLLRRFQREAYILLRLSDPHIVRVVDYGNDNHMYFIVMDYIDGQNLKDHLSSHGQMDALRAIGYARQIAEGLDTAHRRGVVHRDIKPQNLLISMKDVIKIVDFGLARSQESITMTESNVFMGTAYYIAPEQASNGHGADIRADLYSAAVVLFEMLAGYPPFEGEAVIDLVMKHMQGRIPSICRLRHDLPPGMDAFLQKALAKLPDDRYPNPQAFIIALDEVAERVRKMQRNLNMPVENLTAQYPARVVIVASGQSFPLSKDQVVLGRRDPLLDMVPDIDLSDKTVGRRHACLRYQQGTYTVEDLNSMNKTRLNGVILPPHEQRPLNNGDIVRVGMVDMRFEVRIQPSQALPPYRGNGQQ